MEAALELVSAVIDKKQYGKRDTLAMPILYNARHAVELSLKFVIDRLHAAGALAAIPSKDHDIKAHWEHIESARLGDAALRKHTVDLQPFVDSLHAVDPDGQQLRYAETRDGQQSLADQAICDLTRVRKSLRILSQTLSAMNDRAEQFAAERATGTFTRECSRSDLMRIATMLPHRSEWSQPAFSVAKSEVVNQFGLSSRKFSAAVDVIKRHREMGGSVGFEFQLAYLNDEHLRFVLEQWSDVHPPRKSADETGIDFFNRTREMDEYFAAKRTARKAVVDVLSASEIADLETLFYIGRDQWFCELYEHRLEMALKAQAISETPAITVEHLMSKTNMLQSIVRGLEIVGRRRLATEMRELRPASDDA